MDLRIQHLCDRITLDTQERLKRDGLACQCNLDNAICRYKDGKKYIKIDIGTSGRYMVDQEGNIYGIKAYGVIHRGHYFGTLDTIDQYFWGDYTARRMERGVII